VLGLALKFQSPGWSESSTGETSLGLHPTSEKNPAGSIELGFNVANLEKFHQETTSKGFSSACLRRNRILEEVLLNSSTQKVGLAALPSKRQTLPIELSFLIDRSRGNQSRDTLIRSRDSLDHANSAQHPFPCANIGG
jgi:hypothetical protein